MLRMTLYFTYNAVSNQRTSSGGWFSLIFGSIATKVVDKRHQKGKSFHIWAGSLHVKEYYQRHAHLFSNNEANVSRSLLVTVKDMRTLAPGLQEFECLRTCLDSMLECHKVDEGEKKGTLPGPPERFATE
jgi:hypothetical protein